MQVDGAAQGVSTRSRRRRLNMLLAIVVIAAMVALLVWAAPLARSGVGAQDINPSAGSAITHDDAGYVHRDAGSAVIHDDPWNLHPN